MFKQSNGKSKIGVVIVVIIILLILFALWYFLLRDKGANNNTVSNNTEPVNATVEGNENTVKDKTPTKKKIEYSYREGVLNQILDENGDPRQEDFIINGVILIGNRHYGAGDIDIVDEAAERGYRTDDITSSFYLNEYIAFYVAADYSGSESDVKILATPHKTIEEYDEMTYSQILELAEEKGFVMDYQKPEQDNYYYIGENYVSMDYPEGKYDLLFMYKGNIAYYICIDLTLEEA